MVRNSTFEHKFLNRILISSLGRLKPKHLQQSFITPVLDYRHCTHGTRGLKSKK